MAAHKKIPELASAKWVGPYSRLYDGTELVPHVTVVDISPHEAAASEHWELTDKTLQKAVIANLVGAPLAESPLATPTTDTQEGDA